ncbi:hypothetical protein IV498_16990 [Paenarthrobacter sp. Z7-10]|uniref:YciI family protein n=1 Tax=Paenarthrobacter sp. Z7-10 TaxID=2787635 RepID=UPI0022A9CC28|nr:YciI family protein [Paenarthrobacter sp. Z7-10]MCZ2404824.1 hypothetical protein [Paenarthrobacter sp. Z7-10]
MRYMLLMNYEGGAGCDVPMGEWAQEDIAAHIEFMHGLNRELTEAGEFVDAQGLAAPETSKVVTWDGRNAPVITDGPFAESKEFLAGYWIVDVDSAQRALDIAAKASTAPGNGGVPIQQPIEVRQVMAAPALES